jgi:hypothetical protein
MDADRAIFLASDVAKLFDQVESVQSGSDRASHSRTLDAQGREAHRFWPLRESPGAEQRTLVF